MNAVYESEICPVCNVHFKKTYLRKHISRKHYKNVIDYHQNVERLDHYQNGKRSNIICVNCKKVCFSRNFLRTHISKEHNIVSEESSFKKDTWQDFMIWFNNEEKSLNIHFTKVRAPKKLASRGVRINYYCQYNKSINRIVVADKDRRRAPNFKGNYKMEGSCPAEIIVEKCIDGSVDVKYFSTHMGHETSTAHFWPSKEYMRKLSEKLKACVPFRRILNDIRDNPSNDFIREDYVSKKFLENLANKLRINKNWKQDADDMTSVLLWVEHMNTLSDNPVCFFKMPEEDHHLLQKSDFVLVIMTEIQSEILREFGNGVVCLDSTHGTKNYNFLLTTLMVVDDYEEGFPVAYLLSNRVDTCVMELFFEHICLKLNLTLTPSIFMSDDYPAYYNAWIAVMQPMIPPRRLLSTWHVDKNWRKVLQKMKGQSGMKQEKKAAVYLMLRTLMEELDESTFLTFLGTVMTTLMSDVDTEAFGRYFRRKYANRAHMWAYCHRIGCCINSNTKIENLHRLIKIVYNKSQKMCRLDSCINTLLNVVKDKYYERIMKSNDLESPKIINQINSVHCIIETDAIKKEDGFDGITEQIDFAHCQSIDIETDAVKEEDGFYSVKSQSQNGICYEVRKIYENCPHSKDCNLICRRCGVGVCIHLYQCTCVESTIKCHMCKHIHKVCSLLYVPNVDNVSENKDMSDPCTRTELNEQRRILLQQIYESAKKYCEEPTQTSILKLELANYHLTEAAALLSQNENKKIKLNNALKTITETSSSDNKITNQRLFSTDEGKFNANELVHRTPTENPQDQTVWLLSNIEEIEILNIV